MENFKCPECGCEKFVRILNRSDLVNFLLDPEGRIIEEREINWDSDTQPYKTYFCKNCETEFQINILLKLEKL